MYLGYLKVDEPRGLRRDPPLGPLGNRETCQVREDTHGELEIPPNSV